MATLPLEQTAKRCTLQLRRIDNFSLKSLHFDKKYGIMNSERELSLKDMPRRQSGTE
jgi:hypothetical protein